MNIYIIQFINYTLSFFMWMILGRVVLMLISESSNLPDGAVFVKITDPVYRITKRIIPFAKEGWIPFLSVVLIIIMRLSLMVYSQPDRGSKIENHIAGGGIHV